MDAVVHFEIPTKKYDRAKKFYQEIFGWRILEWPASGKRYGLATTTKTGRMGPLKPRAINGGLMEGPEAYKKATIITVAVNSIDKYQKKIKAAGGKKLTAKQKVGDMGYAAYFSDPEGNTVGLWETIG